jgi:hypothetical protein
MTGDEMTGEEVYGHQLLDESSSPIEPQMRPKSEKFHNKWTIAEKVILIHCGII